MWSLFPLLGYVPIVSTHRRFCQNSLAMTSVCFIMANKHFVWNPTIFVTHLLNTSYTQEDICTDLCQNTVQSTNGMQTGSVCTASTSSTYLWPTRFKSLYLVLLVLRPWILRKKRKKNCTLVWIESVLLTLELANVNFLLFCQAIELCNFCKEQYSNDMDWHLQNSTPQLLVFNSGLVIWIQLMENLSIFGLHFSFLQTF